MAYYDVETAVKEYIEKYGIEKAITKAQVRKGNAKSKPNYLFWVEVESRLKEMIPKKKGKWD